MKALLSYGIALAGLAVVVLALLKAMATNLSYPGAKLMLTNLLRTNPNKAEAVCKSLPGTFFEPLASTFNTIAQIGMRDPNIVIQTTRPTFDGIAKGVIQGFNAHMTKAKLGMMAVVGGLVLSVLMATKPAEPKPDDPNYDPTADVVEVEEPGFFSGPGPFIIIFLLAGAGAGMIYARKADLERSIVRARAELLPELEKSIIEGRYQFPPKKA
ncbi:MAG: hypothetical protein M4D80_04830 [Myxococcota bacterium]|nr:hypothetical protein [Deltaproteobacteria bacterium]MDQ3334462.1 hypothetical protein [Myxococcota bacterium]